MIERWENAEGTLKKSVRCPQCHSSRVEYPQMTRKSILPVLIGHLLIALRVMPKEYYCQDCQFTWFRGPKFLTGRCGLWVSARGAPKKSDSTRFFPVDPGFGLFSRSCPGA